ncbi:MAG: hypothetical protein ABW079_01985 [Sedimenticola sp.]
MKSIFVFVLMVSLLPVRAQAEDCGSLQNHYGPFDYRVPSNRRDKLHRVERSHFSDVTYRFALAGASSKEYYKHFNTGNKAKNTAIPSDIDYTLRAFPNHRKALYAMSEYQRVVSSDNRINSGTYRDAECYYIRALQFVPDDSKVLMLYGMHFHKRKQYERAREKYQLAEESGEKGADLFYNLGLVNYHLGIMDEAQKYADKAYKMGYPLKGLSKMLRGEK